MSRPIGSSTWFDYGSTDPEVAKAFYSGLFGWEFEDGGEEFNHYNMIRNDGALVGGFMDIRGMTCPAGEPLHACWDVYLTADDVEARVTTAVEKGATVIVPPGDAGPAGRFAIARDPSMHVFNLWQAGDTEGYEFTASPGSPVWVELMTPKFDEARAFYGAVFGDRFAPMSAHAEDCDAPQYLTFGAGDEATWGLGDTTGLMPDDAAGWRIYFGVVASDEALAKVVDLGGTVLDGPMPSPFGTIATIADPSGATFQICAMSEAVQQG